jgi:hypothetical protein
MFRAGIKYVKPAKEEHAVKLTDGSKGCALCGRVRACACVRAFACVRTSAAIAHPRMFVCLFVQVFISLDHVVLCAMPCSYAIAQRPKLDSDYVALLKRVLTAWHGAVSAARCIAVRPDDACAA